MQKNTNNSYAPLSRFFHWTMGVIIIALLVVGYVMGDLPKPYKGNAYFLHKSFGILILMTIWLRMAWRFVNEEPGLPQSMPQWQVIFSKLNIKILYLLMVLMPLSGFLLSFLGNHPINFFGLFTIPGYGEKHPFGAIAYEAHEIIGLILAILVGLHIVAAFYHHFFQKDHVLLRMLGCKEKK